MFPRVRTTVLIALVAILPAVAQAQASPTAPPPCDSACTAHSPGMSGMQMGMGMIGMGNMEMCMSMMAAGDARLDSLVTRMDRMTGTAKVDAMARVIDELVTQRKAMGEHMTHMMQMMHSQSVPGSAQKDSTDHSGDH